MICALSRIIFMTCWSQWFRAQVWMSWSRTNIFIWFCSSVSVDGGVQGGELIAGFFEGEILDGFAYGLFGAEGFDVE